MAKSLGTIGKGTLLQRDTYPATNQFTSVVEVLDIAGPKRSRGSEDFTHQESPDDYVEKKPTLKDAGSVEWMCHLLPSDPTQDNITGLGADFESGNIRNWRLRYTNYDGSFSYRYFQGFVNKCEDAAPIKSKKTFAVGIDITGKPTDDAPAV